MPSSRLLKPLALAAMAMALATGAHAAPPKPYQVEWVYRVKYGFQDEWWSIFQKYQIAILDREQQLGYVTRYTVTRPGLHVSEDSRWDYRIVITYPNQDGATTRARSRRRCSPMRPPTRPRNSAAGS